MVVGVVVGVVADLGTARSLYFVDQFSRVSQRCATPHALWDVLYSVSMLIGCRLA